MTLAPRQAFPAPAAILYGVKQDERAPFVKALQRARVSAYPPGEFVEQESFMLAGEIRALAARAGIAPGVSVLDLCCGVAGPGRFITRELGCTYLGVDLSSSAIDIARERAGDLPCRFEVSRIPPLPAGPFDVVLLLETMLAFPDKESLLAEISRALATGGRFAFTMEEGLPLTEAERASDARRRHGLAHPAAGDAHLPGARRAGRPLAGGLQSVPPCRGGFVDRRVCRRCDGHRRADRTRGPSRSCWRPTGSGATGCGRDGSASSPSLPRRANEGLSPNAARRS